MFIILSMVMALWIHVCMYQIVHFKYMCTQLYLNNSVKKLSLENAVTITP